MIMVPFLTQFIDKVLATDVPMHDTAIILPNRRARRKIQQDLLERNGNVPMFAPHIFTMEEFVGWLSGLKVTDQVSQLLRLYSSTRDYRGDRFELHGILSWGSVFLKDISDMDMQMQDVQNSLKEYAAAARFEIPFGKDEPSAADLKKIYFNDCLADIYLDFKKLMKEHGEAYEGMVYRDCAENMPELSAKIPFRRFVFAGFYALSPSELAVVSYLRDHFPTEIYFDLDPFYCHLDTSAPSNANQQETSFFIRRNCEKLGIDLQKLEFCGCDYAENPKTVNVVATSGNMRQIYCAIREVNRIVQQKSQNGADSSEDDKTVLDMSDTAVVLADENLLLPFLLSYKPEKVLVNATMGIPFATTPVYALIQQLLAVYESAVSLSSDIAAESLFSGEMVEQLWEHELLRLAKPQAAYFPTVLKYSQLPHSELFASDSKTIQSRLFPTVLLRFCQFAESVTVETLYKSLWKEVNRILSEMQTEFNNFFAENELVDFAFLKFAVTKETSMVTISMEGDSTKGLQVMGLLETRLMDFKNVIMLSVNEGVLPKGITYDSLLPFDFKFKLDGKDALPNYLYQDQVYAYHFFRLLQRAENVSLIYNRASDVSIAERSRFIAQLEYEAQVQNLSNIKINHYKLDFNLDLPACEPLKIEKSEDIMKRLHAFEFSASSLQAYIACPLKFCFRFLMRIRETQVLGDRMESYELGTVVHALFKKALDEVAAEPNPDNFGEIINRHIARTDEDVCAEIRKLKGRKDLSDSDLSQGQWLINRRVIGETVNRYLEVAKRELRDPSWKITDNELQINQLRYPVVSEDGNRRIEVVLTGSLDRVQKCGNNAMILDYKTGKVEASKLQVKVPKTNKKKAEAENQEMAEPDPLAPIFDNPDYEKLFQLVFYAIMYDFYCPQKPETVQAGIISTHEINKNNPNYIFHASILGDGDLLKHKTDLSKHLDKLFLKIFDDKTPFLQTEDTKRCKNCEFLHLCGRQTVTGSY